MPKTSRRSSRPLAPRSNSSNHLAFNDLNRLQFSGQAVHSRGLSFAFSAFCSLFQFFATAPRALRT
jgi:hypothetical protein